MLGVGGRGEEELGGGCLRVYNFGFAKRKEFWRLYNNVNALNVTEQYFMACIFYHNKRRGGRVERERGKI